MRTRIAIAAALFCIFPQPARTSGCFGGQPDIRPDGGSPGVPSNARVTIARRTPASVLWFGPDEQRVSFDVRTAGSGPSAARILTPTSSLRPGIHTIQTTNPDLIHTFTVRASADLLPPDLAGKLVLEAFNAPEPSSECPDNIFIRAAFPTPRDDRTDAADLTYLVWIRHEDGGMLAAADLVLPAEAIVRGQVFFRFGETGCGCVPRVKLQPGMNYRVTVRAGDAAGHESTNALSGIVSVPLAGAGRSLR
jgi:hypothetical protein